MSAAALALVLGAALLHALWNIVAKRTGGDASFALLSNSLMVVLWAPLALYLGWDSVPYWLGRDWLVLVASGLVHGIYFAALLRGYRQADLTVVYPIARGSGPLLASLGAVLVLGEHLSVLAALGIGSVVTGVFFIAGGPSIWRRKDDPTARKRVRSGLLWGAITGVFIGLYTLLDGYAVKALLLVPILVNYFTNLFTLPLLLPSAMDDRGRVACLWKTQWRAALVVAVIGPIGYVMVLYALRLAPLSHVAPAREVSMLFAALLGGRLLGEGERASRLLGAGLIAAGVGGLALG